MIGKAGVDAAADHVGCEERDIAGAAGEDILRPTLQRGHQGMNAHLPDDHALAQRLLVKLRTEAGRPQRAVPVLLDDDFRIQLGADHRDLGILDLQFGEDFLGNGDHPIQIAIAAGHTAAAEDHGAADLLARRDHVPVIGLHGLAFKILGARAEIIRASVH